MNSKQPTKTLVQCDFDGTITEEDVSFAMLDAFADGDWESDYTDNTRKAKYPSGASILTSLPWSRPIGKAC